jgi:response regulator NasT
MQTITLSGEATRETAAIEPILLISADRPTMATVGAALRSAGFEVVEALNNVTALEACLIRRPSLAVIDYQMPEFDGIQLARKMTELCLVPFVLLSARVDEAISNAAVTAGATAYLVKPINPEQIVSVVRTALRRSQELQALQAQTERLTVAVRTGKQVGIATGLVMANLKLDQQEAFECLRRQARARRTRLEDFAGELLRIADASAEFYRSLGTSDMSRRETGEHGRVAQQKQRP